MNAEDIRTLLAERAAAVDGRPPQVDELFGRIRTRRRQRAAVVVVGTGCAVLALVLGIVTWSGSLQTSRSLGDLRPLRGDNSVSPRP